MLLVQIGGTKSLLKILVDEEDLKNLIVHLESLGRSPRSTGALGSSRTSAITVGGSSSTTTSFGSTRSSQHGGASCKAVRT